MGIVARIIGTIIVLSLVGWVDFAWNMVGTLASGKIAGLQFQDSDSAYITAMTGMRFFSDHSGFITLIGLAVVLLIWLGPLKRAVTTARTSLPAIIAVVIAGGLLASPAYAYFDTTNRSEAYNILPNQSAFWVPDVGDNKSGQVQFDSEDYYNQNKVAGKRFAIPHHKFQNSGGWMSFDAYVPDGRLYIVDRTTFSHEWVDAHDRGTSGKKEGFPCQTNEGLNVTVGISVGATVEEKDAAKYLFNFGVIPPKGEPTDPAVIFASVYYSRSVADVMNDVGRKLIQGLACREIAARTLDMANKDTNAIMETISKTAIDELKTFGITVKFIGWADTFSFDGSVQKGIDDKYVANILQPYLPTLTALASIKVQEGISTGIDKHGMPFVVTPGMIEALTNLGNGAAAALSPSAPAPAPAPVPKAAPGK